MQALRLSTVPSTLGLGDLRFDVAIKMARLELLAITGRHRVLESQIEAHRLARGDRRDLRDFNRQTDPPVPDRVLGEATGFPRHSVQSIPLPDLSAQP